MKRIALLRGCLFLATLFLLLAACSSEGRPATTLTETTYMDIVTPLLENANPENGNALIEEFGCHVCHRLGVANGLAPSFVGLATRAAERRPPLQAAAYIYESIIYPSAYLVPGFANAMPQDFRRRLSDQQLGDLIAYLLSPDAQ